MYKKSSRTRLGVHVAARSWASYSIAGAAMATATGESAEAGIYYTGPVNLPANSPITTSAGVVLANMRFWLSNSSGGFYGGGYVQGVVADVAATVNHSFVTYAANLPYGANLSDLHSFGRGGLLSYFPGPPWGNFSGGIGYLGLRFDFGAGSQYGWVRVDMGLPPSVSIFDSFTVVDWAYADPGEPIRVGQTVVPESGSLEPVSEPS